jgi:hypothetical protein
LTILLSALGPMPRLCRMCKREVGGEVGLGKAWICVVAAASQS